MSQPSSHKEQWTDYPEKGGKPVSPLEGGNYVQYSNGKLMACNSTGKCYPWVYERGSSTPIPANKMNHGHVHPRDDGFKARCGVPAICDQCREEWNAKRAAVKASQDQPGASSHHPASAEQAQHPAGV